MIVKNEAHVIRRCLDSLKDYVDFILIHDTGSTDGTIQTILKWAEENDMDQAMFVYDATWQDFAHNRSLVMADLARRFPEFDYGFMVDADNVFVPSVTPEEFRSQLGSQEFFNVEVHTGIHAHTVPLIYRNRQTPYQYKGVLHEFLDRKGGTTGTTSGFHLDQIQDSARNQNPRKYQDDAAVLVKALATETDPQMRSRYQFYLAQSYRDANELYLAVDAYEERAALGGWDQEVFYCYLSIGRIFIGFANHPNANEEARDHYEAMAIDSFLRAYQACPYRAESMHELAQYYRSKGMWNLAFLYASIGVQIPVPPNPLFIRRDVYDWAMLDELAIAAFYTGKYPLARETNAMLLARWERLPVEERPRIFKNLQLTNEKIHNTPS